MPKTSAIKDDPAYARDPVAWIRSSLTASLALSSARLAVINAVQEERLASFVIALWRRVDEHVLAILRLSGEPDPLPESIGILARVLWEARVKAKYLRKHRTVAYRQMTWDGLDSLRRLAKAARVKSRVTRKNKKLMDSILSDAEAEAAAAKAAAKATGKGVLDPARHPGLPKLDELAALLKIKWEYRTYVLESAGTHVSFAAASQLMKMTPGGNVRQADAHPNRVPQVLSLAVAAYANFLVDIQAVLGLPTLGKKLDRPRYPFPKS